MEDHDTRRDNGGNGVIVPPCTCSGEEFRAPGGGKGSLRVVAAAINGSSVSNYDMAVSRNVKKTQKRKGLQELFTDDYIVNRVLRKDGPSLGQEFDFLPSGPRHTFACQEDQGSSKKRKGSKSAIRRLTDCNRTAPVKKHGIGKGLMTVWRATNPDAGDLPINFGVDGQEVPLLSVNNRSRKTVNRNGELCVTQNQSPNKSCGLALDNAISEEGVDRVSMLIDDEELELRELQEETDLFRCSNHLAASGMLVCSLCKDALVKFPPDTVKMKKPIHLQPWDSSPEIVKKLFKMCFYAHPLKFLFYKMHLYYSNSAKHCRARKMSNSIKIALKVFHFIYTYAIIVDICPFTLDELVQAFHDKDSMLLGKIHVALLTLLLSDIEVELTNGFSPHLNKSCNFLALLHSVESQEYSLDFWRRSLNSLTWIEILRQVLVASGFGSKQGSLRRDVLNKELNLLVNYGLCPGTLKSELFNILSERGNTGCKVVELAKSMQIVELNLASTTEELESLICSALSSDITLFEKISATAYRLRMSTVMKDSDESHSDTEYSGSVDDELNDTDTCSSADDFENDSINSSIRKLKSVNSHKKNMRKIYTEIDESRSGEAWLLGLMESEYSNLNIEEKLNALAALTDLVSSGSSVRMKDLSKVSADCNSSIQLRGSGAKIKRSVVKKPGSLLNHKVHLNSDPCSVDSSSLFSRFHNYEAYFQKGNGSSMSHPIQSVFLGSDRRYNRYWLFLGPCNVDDPGHRRIYFESSEDGHWEVIDTVEALCALMSILDDRGKREALLIESLERRQTSLCRSMARTNVNSTGMGSMSHSDQSELDMVTDDSYSPASDVDNLNMTETAEDSFPSDGAVVIEAGKKVEDLIKKWIRVQEYDSWIWNSFYSDLNVVKYGRRSYMDSLAKCKSCHDLYWRDERHCKICHMTFELDFDLEEKYAIHIATCREKEDNNTFPNHKVLPSHIQSLKAAVYAIESVMPEDALVGAWRKSAHKLWVKRLRRTSTLLELLQVLDDFVGAINKDWLFQCKFPDDVFEEIIASFASMPRTSSALGLWLVKLDVIIAPYLDRVHPLKKQGTGQYGPWR
ncbi:homeobox-DDT domain protein RLT3 isoform X2 [Vigna radiata var. radiata]|uniref:Homeobox-DDT domain protein RLT3 isoform X2 n=1 Tax=Vigna radiata var. radiata TaxID=3916 RepID=A0A3Q0F8S4_VIGRR|nr:homeobox-DDT domain protein RLT3 isoform X2 [Vigna radiata var. radiata]